MKSRLYANDMVSSAANNTISLALGADETVPESSAATLRVKLLAHETR